MLAYTVCVCVCARACLCVCVCGDPAQREEQVKDIQEMFQIKTTNPALGLGSVDQCDQG